MSERAPLLNRQPQHAAHQVTVVSSLAALWNNNLWFNVFGLVFIPLGIISSAYGWSDGSVFALNCLAIIPLAKMLDFATDQLAMRTNETIGGLLNATFGNAVELILSIMALKEGLLHVVQASMIGSILSNLLLVLGFCFLCGGLFPFQFNKFQEFDADKANVSTGLLSLTFLGFLVPCVLRFELPKTVETEKTIVNLSRGISVVLLIIYVSYLVFQLYTNPDGLKVTPKRRVDPETPEATSAEDNEEEEEEPETLLWIALAALAGSTLIIAFSAELLVGSIEGLSKQAGISETFIGIIILPIVGNAAEHVTAVSSAMRNKMDLSIQVAVGSSHQIALMVTPAVVLFGWFLDKDMNLDFGAFSTAVLLVSTLVVNALIQDGRTHWFEGEMLIGAYIIIAVGYYFVPDPTAHF
ncbi:UNVERIFIED_CONTAM: hypothetical protein HDU68_004320 [Siphonaria sp. JEL0065]|nr:hypothetical protein HDU68_004320 [Siphonaria sp. JEL0065]